MFLEISGIKKHFGEGESRVEVLKGIDAEIEKGEICVLLGPSGSGKSALLNIIGGIDNADSGVIKSIEEENVTLCENFYTEEDTDDFESTLRIFADRKDVNAVCLLDGEMPASENEIALDRLYAKNNELSVGDGFSVAGRSLKVTGIIALPDYSALFQNNTDFMFDTIKFGVSVMTEDGFESMGDRHIHYSYSWKYDDPPKDRFGNEAKDMADDFMEAVSAKAPLTNFIPCCSSNAMKFAGEDLGQDRIFVLALVYILIVIIAFVFVITTSSTISRESNVIGTLRASGYTKGELIRHYMAAPIIVLFTAAVVGNILGYTLFKNIMADQYLGSYSLVSYKTLWNAEAFVLMTVVPIIIMTLINFIMLARMMSLSPLKFIRRDLKRHQKKKAFRLNTKIKFMTRFKLRVILQNISNYVTIFVGILFSGVIIVFGMMFMPLLDNVEKQTLENIPAQYQYVLKAPVETKTENAEKYSVSSLKVTNDGFTESVSLYGISDNSKYIKADLSDEKVYISSAYSDKYGVEAGDELTLKEEFGSKKYTLAVDGIYDNPSTLAVFIGREHFNELLEQEDDCFTGYMSDKEIEDIDENLIATVVSEDDYQRSTRQLKQSFSSMVNIFWIMGAAVFMLVIYLLAKIIIEKNAQSISIAKILGYEKKEIDRVYIHTTTLVTIVSLFAVMPLVDLLIEMIWHSMMSRFTGWIPYVTDLTVYGKAAALGIVTYIVVAALLMRRTNKIPLSDALKNVE